MCVIPSEGCACGVVGPDMIHIPLLGGVAGVCVELNNLGWLTGERDSRVDGSCVHWFGLVPE